MFWQRTLVLCLVYASLAQPQSPPPQSKSDQPAEPQQEIVSREAPASFSSRLNLVTVPVVVRDRSGHPVGGLRQEDFQLFDKGKAQIISRFSLETGKST